MIRSPPTCGLGNERWYEPSMLGTYLSLVAGLWIPVAVMMGDDGVIGAFQKAQLSKNVGRAIATGIDETR